MTERNKEPPILASMGQPERSEDQVQRLPAVSSEDWWVMENPPTVWQRTWENVADDHLNFYSPHNLALLGLGVGVAASLANTNADHAIHDFYQENVRDAATDEYWEALHTPKFLGNGLFTLPTFAGAVVIGAVFDSNPAAVTLGEWGDRSLRSVAVGTPPLLLLQNATGGSRPGETSHKSHWMPFQDNNGVSGHSFMGAVPFIAAAQMSDDPWLKTLLYTASTATGFSRINDNGHYASQVALGWWIAYLACSAVDTTNDNQSHWHITPVPTAEGAGIGIMFEH